MQGGYMGKMLFVDLTQGKTWDEPLDESMCSDFIGGYGLGARIIFERQQAKVDPLGPDNVLGFVTGPLTGTPALIGSRYVVVCKSPLTGTWGDANSGGDFGPHLKFAGYDAVFFLGASARPVYLNIDSGKAELRSVDHLWGRDSHETEDILQEELGKDTRVACIGQSGETLSLISCVINNKGRAAGRSGVGAVMGSKKLKAIAVNGKQAVPVAIEAQLQESRKKYLEQMKASIIFSLFSEAGTPGGMEFLNLTGEAPFKNWGGIATVDLPDITALMGPAVNELREKRYGCWRCPLSCGALMKAGTGRYKYPAGSHRPEYETLGSFGNMCLNNNLESVMMANDICNRFGLDTISAGTAIAFAIECFENGIITGKDTDGVELRWGNHEAIVAMTEKLARREGFGDVLADGVKVASERIGKGSEQYAIHVHGQEPGLHDPRAAIPFATAFLEATPGRHTQGNDWLMSGPGLPFPAFDPMSCSGRGEVHKIAADMNHVMNSAGVCQFGSLCMDAQHLPDFLNTVTGSTHSLDDLLKIGERIANIRQAFNIREGVTTKDYKLPGRILGQPPLPDGPTAGRTVDADTLRREFFQQMDWDPDTGKPSKAKLTELGLKDVAQALWPG
jgi:aldehyde:ferredoxin oxidoreductase